MAGAKMTGQQRYDLFGVWGKARGFLFELTRFFNRLFTLLLH